MALSHCPFRDLGDLLDSNQKGFGRADPNTIGFITHSYDGDYLVFGGAPDLKTD